MSTRYAEYKLIHYRPIGTLTNTHQGLSSRIHMGENNYYIGYHPLFAFFKGIKMMFTEKPYFATGIAYLWSYIKCYVTQRPRIDDKRIIKKLEEIQLCRIFRNRYR